MLPWRTKFTIPRDAHLIGRLSYGRVIYYEIISLSYFLRDILRIANILSLLYKGMNPLIPSWYRLNGTTTILFQWWIWYKITHES